jgi:inhibitor of cysteine peptidase
VRRVLSWSLAVAILLAAAVWGGLALHERATFGTKITEKDLTVEVDEGDRFSLAVPDRGASVGDAWSATVAPDGVVAAVEDRKVMSNVWDRVFGPQAGGGAGTRYFIYTAEGPGTVRVTLANCFQGCRDGYSRGLSREVTWTVTVG